MADDCSVLFALFPIIFVFVLISVLSRAMRSGSRMGGYSGYGGSGGYRYYGNSYYAAQYLSRPGPGSYQSPSYPSYGPAYGTPYTPPAYRTGPYTPVYGQPYNTQAQGSYPGYPAGQYGSAFPSAPAPAYSGGQPGMYPQAPSQGPAPEVAKVSCSYCGSLNPGSEQNCLLCGAPMK